MKILIICVLALGLAGLTGCGHAQKCRNMVDTAFELGVCSGQNNRDVGLSLLNYYTAGSLYGTSRHIFATGCGILYHPDCGKQNYANLKTVDEKLAEKGITDAEIDRAGRMVGD